MTSKVKELPLNKIRIDGGTQSRVKLNESIVEDYAERIQEGDEFPNLEVVFDGSEYFLWDGFKRWHAHRKAGLNKAFCNVMDGTRREAILLSVGANRTHGEPRKREDKRNAVKTLLEDAEWAVWSDSEIARRCGVSHTFVGEVRKTVTCNVASENRQYTGKSGTVSTMNTENIGAKKEDLPPLPALTATLSPVKDVTPKSKPKEEPAVKPEKKQETEADTITDPVEQALACKGKWEAAIRAVQAVQKLAEELKDTPAGGWMDDNRLQEFKAKRDNLVEVLKDTKPHSRCPYCEGKKCRNCRNLGFVTANIARNAPEKKEG